MRGNQNERVVVEEEGRMGCIRGKGGGKGERGRERVYIKFQNILIHIYLNIIHNFYRDQVLQQRELKLSEYQMVINQNVNEKIQFEYQVEKQNNFYRERDLRVIVRNSNILSQQARDCEFKLLGKDKRRFFDYKFILRKNVQHNSIIELETKAGIQIIKANEIRDLIPDRNRDDQFQITIMVGNSGLFYFKLRQARQFKKNRIISIPRNQKNLQMFKGEKRIFLQQALEDKKSEDCLQQQPKGFMQGIASLLGKKD